MAVDLRAVDGFVATGGPARALRQTRGVIAVADEDAAVARLLLEMAFQAERRIALVQHPLVHRAVRRMATDAAFAERFVLEDERPALRSVTLETGFVVAEQRGSATLERLRQVGSATFDGVAFVWVVTISTTDLALQDGMVMRQLKCRAHFGMALETGRGRLSRIHDLGAFAAALYMQTSRAVARFAAHV